MTSDRRVGGNEDKGLRCVGSWGITVGHVNPISTDNSSERMAFIVNQFFFCRTDGRVGSTGIIPKEAREPLLLCSRSRGSWAWVLS